MTSEHYQYGNFSQQLFTAPYPTPIFEHFAFVPSSLEPNLEINLVIHADMNSISIPYVE